MHQEKRSMKRSRVFKDHPQRSPPPHTHTPKPKGGNYMKTKNENNIANNIGWKQVANIVPICWSENEMRHKMSSYINLHRHSLKKGY